MGTLSIQSEVSEYIIRDDNNHIPEETHDVDQQDKHITTFDMSNASNQFMNPSPCSIETQGKYSKR